MFGLALFTQVLLASAALARPSIEERNARRQGKPATRIAPTNITHEEYSSNWAGVVLNSPKGTYKSVTATFVVPTPKAPSGGSSGTEYSASAWVGIDGDTCGTAILQTGVDFNVQNGKVSYDAWYEWYPDYAYDFSGIPISAGNTIQLTVTATSTKAGSAVIKNLSTGKSVTKSLTSTAALCQQDAEWIVEDFEEGSSLVPFANFGTVTFSSASAGLNAGGSVGPSGSGSNLIDIKQGSTVLTSSSASSGSATVSYV